MVSYRPHGERPVSEGDIQAYTDGSLPGERAARVRRYLAARPGEWHRILFYRRLNAQLRHAFGDARAEPDAPAPSRPGIASSGGAGRSRAVALALSCLLAGAALAWFAVSESSAQVLNDAAVMALMEAGSGAAASAARDSPDSPGAPLGDLLGPVPPASVPAPFDFAPAGLRLVASGTVELGLLVRAQRWVYENDDGKPVVLLASRAWFARAEPQWSARRVGNLRLLGWTGHGERWVLAGNAQTRGLMRAADLATQEPVALDGLAADREHPR